MRRLALGVAAILLWPVAVVALEAPPRVPAESWLLVDHTTGDVLVEHDADRRLAPASLTKLMTAYLLFERLAAGEMRLQETVRISRRAARTGGSRIALRPEAEAKVEDLVKSMLLRSANNAAVALAEHAAGSEADFVAEMNARARAWGLNGTTFANTHGLDAPGHRSTARDLSRIAAALIRDFPDYYGWFSLPGFTFNGAAVRNGNRLLRRDGAVDGIKTGYTRDAGWCLITSARRGRTRLIATVLGAPSRRKRVRASKRLLDYGFRNFETRLVHAAAEPVTRARVWMGENTRVALGLLKDVYVTLPRGTYARLKTRLELHDRPYAPVRYGERLGMLTLELDDKVLGRYPLAALENVWAGGPVERTIDNIFLWLN